MSVSIVSPMIGLVATLAPTIGPTVGGYLTDLMSWHWLFLINVVPGIFVTVSTWILVDFDKPNYGLLKSFDWAGLAFMAGFLDGYVNRGDSIESSLTRYVPQSRSSPAAASSALAAAL